MLFLGKAQPNHISGHKKITVVQAGSVAMSGAASTSEQCQPLWYLVPDLNLKMKLKKQQGTQQYKILLSSSTSDNEVISLLHL